MAFTHYRTYGFVFKKEDKGEADRLFTIFTFDYGRIQVLGRAIRKITSKLGSGIGLFCLSEIEFIQGENYKTLTDAQIIEKYETLEKDSKKLKTAFKISDVLNSFIPFEERDEKILDLTVDVFRKLNKIPDSQRWILFYYFLWNFFSVLGYQPELHNCSLCQKKLIPANLYFSSKEGGIICKNCKIDKDKAEKISPELIKILRIIFNENWQLLSKIKIGFNHKKELMKISKIYYFYLLSLFRQSDKMN